jgi:geranylgeranyl pyrophosphate synthase
VEFASRGGAVPREGDLAVAVAEGAEGLVKYRPIMGGKPWRPLSAFLAAQALGPESTKTIRAERDSRY